jgi:glucose/arabinose dehydrogenase
MHRLCFAKSTLASDSRLCRRALRPSFLRGSIERIRARLSAQSCLQRASQLRLWTGIAALCLLGPGVLAGDPEVSNFRENVFVSDAQGLTEITRLAWAPDGTERLFATRLRGEIRIVRSGKLLPVPFATVEPVYVNAECGLLGICFDPNFAVNHYVYCFATVSPDEQQIIRYTDRDDVAIEKTVLIRNLPTRGNRHNGGALAIGQDGKIYWGIGDNGAAVGAKANLTSLGSKIGRANLDGSPANDNPFNDGAGPNNDYIWARGFRNPFVLFFQPATGKLWINDVGGDYEQVFVAGAGDHGGWDFYEANQPQGYLPPVIKYRTNGTDNRPIRADGAVRSDNLVTISTGEPHGFLRGEKIKISGSSPSSFDGEFFVASVPQPTSFTLRQSGLNEAGGGGSAASLKLGGSITGGTFYNSTAFPREFWGNLFFGDYNSGRLLRATLDSNNGITSVDTFATAIRQFLDICVGPDGALYYVGHNSTGTIYRMAHQGGTTKIVVHPTTLSMVEGGKGVLSVRLAAAPAMPVAIDVSLFSGTNSQIRLSQTNVVFTTNNWNVGQTVTLEVTATSDGLDAREIVALSAPGFETLKINVNALEQASSSLILSSSLLEFGEGESGSFTVRLSEAPTSNLTVNVTLSGDSNVALATAPTLIFTRDNYSIPQTVTIAGIEDSDAQSHFATVMLSAPGQAPRTVALSVVDNEPVAASLNVSSPIRATVGAALNMILSGQGNPRPTYSLLNAPAGMSLDPITGNISWVPTARGEFNATVEARNGLLPNATQQLLLIVSDDLPPQARLTKPSAGEVVSGSRSEWFGDGLDDVGTVKAEFYVDGILAYTDINNHGHFHFGGEHLRWDTSLLSDGPHRLNLIVYDTKGQSNNSEINVMVSNTAANQIPQVLVTRPLEGTAFATPPIVLIEASASDADDGVAKVEFFANGQKIGEATEPPYSLVWLNAAAGRYSLTARAIDHRQAASDSAPIQIEVTENIGFEADAVPRLGGRGDGLIGTTDWEQIGRFVAGLETVADTNEFARVDCAPRLSEAGLIRGDGIISLIDWVQVARYGASLDPFTPTGGPVSNQAFADGLNKLNSAGAFDGRALSIIRSIFFANDTNFVAVEIEAMGDENAVGFSIQFDPQKFRYIDTHLGRDASQATLLVNTHEAGAGILGLALALPSGRVFIPGRQQLARIWLAALPRSEGSTSLNLGDHPVSREFSSAEATRLTGGFRNAVADIKSGLSITATAEPDGKVLIECAGIPGRSYVVQGSSDLLTWTIILSLTADEKGNFSFEEREIQTSSSRFYRIIQP